MLIFQQEGNNSKVDRSKREYQTSVWFSYSNKQHCNTNTISIMSCPWIYTYKQIIKYSAVNTITEQCIKYHGNREKRKINFDLYFQKKWKKNNKVYIWFLPWRLGSFNKKLKRGMVVRINIKIKATEVGKLWDYVMC